MEDLELFKAQLKEEIKAEILKDQEEARLKLGFMERNPMFTTSLLTIIACYFLFGLK